MTAFASVQDRFDTYEAFVLPPSDKVTRACSICFRAEGLFIDVGPTDAICRRCFKRADRALAKYALANADPDVREALVKGTSPLCKRCFVNDSTDTGA